MAIVAGDSLGQVASQTLRNLVAVDAAARDHPVLVFVADPHSEPQVLEALQWYNAGPFPGRVVVARDLGPARDAELLRRWPERQALYLRVP